jgi:inorganic pyrophosphatase
VTEPDWRLWERLLEERGVEIDRPRGTDHPRYLGWTYPLDYGYVPGTTGGDGHPVDVFVGSAPANLYGALVVRHDGVEELKLLWNTSDGEAELARAFLADDMDVRMLRRVHRGDSH